MKMNKARTKIELKVESKTFMESFTLECEARSYGFHDIIKTVQYPFLTIPGAYGLNIFSSTIKRPNKIR